MTYQSRRIGPHFLVAWQATPGPRDVVALTADIRAAREDVGAKLHYWLVIRSEIVSMPAGEARAAMQRSMPEVLALTESFDVVIVGDGVKATLLRSGLRAMSIATRASHRVTVHDAVDRALASRAVPPEVATALRALAA